jgi:hypothetical protein
LCPLIVTVGLTAWTLGPSHDQVVFEVPSNIKRLSEGRPLARALPFAATARFRREIDWVSFPSTEDALPRALRVNHR